MNTHIVIRSKVLVAGEKNAIRVSRHSFKVLFAEAFEVVKYPNEVFVKLYYQTVENPETGHSIVGQDITYIVLKEDDIVPDGYAHTLSGIIAKPIPEIFHLYEKLSSHKEKEIVYDARLKTWRDFSTKTESGYNG